LLRLIDKSVQSIDCDVWQVEHMPSTTHPKSKAH